MSAHAGLTSDYLFELSKVVDNRFIGSQDTFSCEKKGSCFFLTTNKCDDASLIRVHPGGGGLTVTRIGPDTEGWEEVRSETYERISRIKKGDQS